MTLTKTPYLMWISHTWLMPGLFNKVNNNPDTHYADWISASLLYTGCLSIFFLAEVICMIDHCFIYSAVQFRSLFWLFSFVVLNYPTMHHTTPVICPLKTGYVYMLTMFT